MNPFAVVALLCGALFSMAALFVLVMTESRAWRREREVWSQRVLAVQEAERAAISRELHDSVVSSISGLAFRMAVHDPAIAAAASRLAGEVRALSHGLYPGLIGHLDVIAALQELVDDWPHTGHELVLAPSSLGTTVLTELQAVTAYRVAQAAITNALQHSGGQRITVQVRAQATRFCLTVRDNGRGWSGQASPTGLGWRTMQVRAASVGGRVSAERVADRGTLVTLEFPVDTA